MGHEQMPQPGRGQGVQKLGSLIVAEMTEVPSNPRFQRWRIGTVTQHVLVVVTLQHQGIAVSKQVRHVLGDMARVRQHTQAQTPALEDELAGLTSIMGHGEGCHTDVADTEAALMPGKQP
jgi:hypothetical protein